MIGELAYELQIPKMLYPSARLGKRVNVVLLVDGLASCGGWVETETPLPGKPERIP
jgi:hypothetical protein